MKTLPHDQHAEKTLIGFMVFGQHMPAILSEIGPEDFYVTANRVIAEVCIDLFSQGQPVDALTVSEQLERIGKLESVGGREYLGNCAGMAFSDELLDGAIALIKDASLLRHGYAATVSASGRFANPTERADELINELQTNLLHLAARNNKASTIDNNTALEKAFLHLDPKKAPAQTGILTGFHDLDYKMGGLQRGELIILAARPSMGKTSLMLNIAVNTAKLGNRVFIFTLEMTAKALAWRLLFGEAKVDMHLGKSGDIHRTGYEDKLEAVHSAFGRLQNLPIIYNEKAFGIMEIISIAQRAASSPGVDLICLDYLGLANSGLRGSSRNEEVAFMSGQLKRLGKELDVPVLCLSQLSRVNETQGAKRPTLNALRDSGALEQDADAVLFIHSDEYYQQKAARPDTWSSSLVIAKQRNGPTAEIQMNYHRPFTRFFGMHEKDEKYQDIAAFSYANYYDGLNQ